MGPDNKEAVKYFRRIREARQRGVSLVAIYVSPDALRALMGSYGYSHVVIEGVKICKYELMKS